MNAGKNILSLVLLLLATGGCATAINGTTQTVYINSIPQGAAVSDNGRPLGMTPVSAVLARGQDHVLTFSMPGYGTTSFAMQRQFKTTTAGNILIGGLIGIAVDACSGANYELTPQTVLVTLPREIARREE